MADATPLPSERKAPSAPQCGLTVEDLRVSVYKIPTDSQESDGTYQWESTTIVIVEADAGGSSR